MVLPICYKFFGQVLKSALIRGVNCGEDYDHHYRRKSRMELTRVWHDIIIYMICIVICTRV